MKTPPRLGGWWHLATSSSRADVCFSFGKVGVRRLSNKRWTPRQHAAAVRIQLLLMANRDHTQNTRTRTGLTSWSTCPATPLAAMLPCVNEKDESADQNEKEQGGLAAINMASISLTEYLQDTIAAVDPSFRMVITEQHRKKMVRCLMGYAGQQITFEQRLRLVRLTWQWECLQHFIHQELIPQFTATATFAKSPQLMDAPLFLAFLENPQPWLQQFAPTTTHTNDNNRAGTTAKPRLLTPFKMFSFLARGRAYKGRFDALLEDVAPRLIPAFHAMVADKSDRDLMRRMVLQVDPGEERWGEDPPLCPLSTERRNQMLQLLDMELPKGITQPTNAGKSSGARGELDLTTYLREHRQQQSSSIQPRMVLSNVLVKPPNSQHRTWKSNGNPSKHVPHFLESAAQLDNGMTSEFDAMIVERVSCDDTNNNIATTHSKADHVEGIRIVELWEAKASVHAVSIEDAMVKKVNAMQAVLADARARFWFFGDEKGGAQPKPIMTPNRKGLQRPRVYRLCNADTSSSGTVFPLLGIFGNDLLSPRASARRVQVVQCEKRLELCPDAVLEAMETGSVSGPDVVPLLRGMVQLALQLQPFLVVPSMGIQGWEK